MNIGESIRKIRKEKNMTSKQLGEKIGCSGNAILLYERGERKLSVEMLDEISKALDINTSDLYNNIGSYFNNIFTQEDINLLKVDLNKVECINKVLEFYDYKLSTEVDFQEFDILIKMFINSKKFEDSQKGEK